jgi:alkylated DNA nucleotide flippase Atl1
MFEERLQEAIAGIPRARTRSISDLAARAGRPWAARAAGRALGKIRRSAAPWQRAVRADGGLPFGEPQLNRLREEGARPRTGEALAAWLARAGATLAGSWRTRRYCRPDCPALDGADRARLEALTNAREASARGFAACPRCRPPRARTKPPDPLRTGRRRARCAAVSALPIGDQLARCGHAIIPRFVDARTCETLQREAGFAGAVRRQVSLEGHAMGRGVYGYVGEGKARRIVDGLRAKLYNRLLDPARGWLARLGRGVGLPDSLERFEEIGAAAGQKLPASTLLRYGPGGWNAPHRDVYGPVVFPFQIVIVLGGSYRGGEFALVELREDEDDLWHVLRPRRGDALVFPAEARPVPAGGRGESLRAGGFRAVEVRHALMPIRSGSRTALGVVLHGMSR